MQETNHQERSSVYVAPLRVEKSRRNVGNVADNQISEATHSRNKSYGAESQSSQHYTPPPSPGASQKSLPPTPSSPQQSQSSYLRAFYPFLPTITPGSMTVTLPLNTGDVVMVHSIHDNGWADGTMLSSGVRGWLPTNYCETFEPEEMKSLLDASYAFFEQLLTLSNGSKVTQKCVTSVVAGVRSLLDCTRCLGRDAPTVKNSERINKSRKLLLSELTEMINTSKRLPGHAQYKSNVVLDELVSDMVLRNFKIVLKAVRFLDIWHNLCDEQAQMNIQPFENIPPTPPSEAYVYSNTNSSSASFSSFGHTVSSHTSYFESPSPLSPQSVLSEVQAYFPLNGISTNTCSRPLPSTPHSETPPGSAITRNSHYSPRTPVEAVNYSHCRLTTQNMSAYVEPISAIHTPSTFALARLNSSHDVLLSYLGSYIGRIHLQARFTPQLQFTHQHSISAAKDLLDVVEAVHARDPDATVLACAKNAMYERIDSLIAAANDLFASRVEDVEEEYDEDSGIVIPDGGLNLVEAATGCVRGAGDCVAKSKFVIERIGDFELEPSPLAIGLGITTDTPVIEAPLEVTVTTNDASQDIPPLVVEKIPPPPPPKDYPRSDSPLTQLDVDTTLVPPDNSMLLPPTPTDDVSRRFSGSSHILPLQQNSDEVYPELGDLPPPSPIIIDGIFGARVSSVCAQSLGTVSTAANSIRGSDLSIISRTSTRATTPDNSAGAEGLSPLSQDDGKLPEDKQVEQEEEAPPKSYAEELTFNKEGQITGGTLRALVEQLTIHDSTPDAVFTNTFYLTFRLFTTPTKFAEALVDRFETVDCDASWAKPIRLRVYNAFKTWLETHWRANLDNEALKVIQDFANDSLTIILPSAAMRLLDLAEKASQMDGQLVPRLVSGMGKGNTTAASVASPDTPLQSPIISRSQLLALKSTVNGHARPSILDFDPLEIARQLTLKESRMFCAICPEELLAQEWTKKTSNIATNVRALSTLATNLAHLVAESILDLPDAKVRARIIKHWIKIADRCLELNNYDTLMAIMCTMNTSTIIRLKKTWELVTPKTKQVLDHLRSVIDVSKNHAVLRARLRGHVPPCIPFLGTYLTDLTFVDVGNPSTRPTSIAGSTITLINFDKHIRTANVISELQRFQIPYHILEIPEMQSWFDRELDRIQNSKEADVQALYRRSLLLEPRERQTPRVNGGVGEGVDGGTVTAPGSPEKVVGVKVEVVKPVVGGKETGSGSGSGRSDLFAWTHMFRTQSSSSS